MRRFVLGMGLTIAAIGMLGQNQAFGSDCGGAAANSGGATTSCGGATANCGCNSKPCCPQCCCTVMQTCQETVYEYKEMTAYKVVYEDVVDKTMVPCTVYEPAPLPTCVPDTVLVPPTPSACKPANPCAPCAPQELVPTNICRKVMLEGCRPVNKEKPAVSTHVVARQVPYQVTICIPHIVTKQVPVTVCCPTTCTCRCHRHCSASAPAAKSACEAPCGK